MKHDIFSYVYLVKWLNQANSHKYHLTSFWGCVFIMRTPGNLNSQCFSSTQYNVSNFSGHAVQ